MQKTLSVINLGAVVRNAARVRKLIGDRAFYAVVKADAYGHGAEQVSRALQPLVDGFCVAIVDEGAQLRISGITKPILVFAPPLCEEDALKMLFYGLTPTVTGVDSAKLVKSPCHIAVNSGMNRYGCYGAELDKVLEILPRGAVGGVYSHLYAAENLNASLAQTRFFEEQAAKVKAKHPSAFVHLAASGGILRGGRFLFEGVRCGLLLYGYAPNGFSGGEFEPALRVYARRTQITKPVGGGVGYNKADKEYKRLCTYRLGYADGFFRNVPLGEKTLCMDAFVSEASGELLPVFENADEYAARCGTISYEVLCSVTGRSEKIYVR